MVVTDKKKRTSPSCVTLGASPGPSWYLHGCRLSHCVIGYLGRVRPGRAGCVERVAMVAGLESLLAFSIPSALMVYFIKSLSPIAADPEKHVVDLP